jgi:hypothetical protein
LICMKSIRKLLVVEMIRENERLRRERIGGNGRHSTEMTPAAFVKGMMNIIGETACP